jgi:transcriptional regulator with XRE-family HTH domain
MMSTNELQDIKRAWLAAEESGDKQAKLALLYDHPSLHNELIEFIAAYHATSSVVGETEILPLTRRAMQRALDKVFAAQPVAAATGLRELRTARGLSLVGAAKGLQLSTDVWKKFENGLIDLSSLGERQLARLATFFKVSADEFGAMLNQSQPSLAINRRQTAEGARMAEEQSQQKQTFAEALARSTMSEGEKKVWVEREG